ERELHDVGVVLVDMQRQAMRLLAGRAGFRRTRFGARERERQQHAGEQRDDRSAVHLGLPRGGWSRRFTPAEPTLAEALPVVPAKSPAPDSARAGTAASTAPRTRPATGCDRSLRGGA